MKRTMKLLSLAVMSALMLANFTGCATTEETNDTIKIGVIQFGSHPSLDNCYTGILEGLESADFEYEIDFQNGNFDQATCDTLAKTMVSNGVDIIIPIATPPAISAYSAGMDNQIPVVFTAVSDAVASGLVESNEVPGGHATGSSSVLNFEKQLDLIKAIQPDLETLGVLYTTSESNAVAEVENLKTIAVDYDVEIVAVGVQSAADIPQAAADLSSKVDALNNVSDNNVVNNLATVIEIATAAGIPVYGSEEEQVENGCVASEGIDYIQIGVAAADLAIEVINGADITTLSVDVIDDATPFINTDVMESFNFEIPEAYADATMITLG